MIDLRTHTDHSEGALSPAGLVERTQPDDRALYREFSEEFDLIPTGGSDFNGDTNPGMERLRTATLAPHALTGGVRP